MKPTTPLEQQHKVNLEQAGTMAARARWNNDEPCARSWREYGQRLIRHYGDTGRKVYEDAYRTESERMRKKASGGLNLL